MASSDRSVTIVPYFKIHAGKMQELKELCQRFVEKTKSETGCLYYGFSFSGDTLFCREGYKDGDAAVAHLQNVASLLLEMQKLTDVIRFEIHGVEDEIAKLRGPLADVKPQYFALEYGFRR